MPDGMMEQCTRCGAFTAFRSPLGLCGLCMSSEPWPLTDHLNGKHRTTVQGCAFCDTAAKQARDQRGQGESGR